MPQKLKDEQQHKKKKRMNGEAHECMSAVKCISMTRKKHKKIQERI